MRGLSLRAFESVLTCTSVIELLSRSQPLQ